MAPSGKWLTSARVMISRVVSLSPALGSALTPQSLEPASDSVSPSLSLSLPHSHSVSLSLKNKKKNIKIFFKKTIELYGTANLNVCTFKKSLRRPRDPKMECRMWQMNLTVLQMYEITSAKCVEDKGADPRNFGNK